MDSCIKYKVECSKDYTSSIELDTAASHITVLNILSNGDTEIGPEKIMDPLFLGSTAVHDFAEASSSILVTFANPDFAPWPSSYRLLPEARIGKLSFFGFPAFARITRILGLMGIISYMIVILFTWISANASGYVYFSAGEPVLSIKYPEWVLGFIGIFTAAYYLSREMNRE